MNEAFDSVRVDPRAAADEESVEVGSEASEGREEPASESLAPPDVELLQPGQEGDHLYQPEVGDAGG